MDQLPNMMYLALRLIAKETRDVAMGRLMKGNRDNYRDHPDRSQVHHVRQLIHSTV